MTTLQRGETHKRPAIGMPRLAMVSISFARVFILCNARADDTLGIGLATVGVSSV
jgi:hypothetical protein